MIIHLLTWSMFLRIGHEYRQAPKHNSKVPSIFYSWKWFDYSDSTICINVPATKQEASPKSRDSLHFHLNGLSTMRSQTINGHGHEQRRSDRGEVGHTAVAVPPADGLADLGALQSKLERTVCKVLEVSINRQNHTVTRMSHKHVRSWYLTGNYVIITYSLWCYSCRWIWNRIITNN